MCLSPSRAYQPIERDHYTGTRPVSFTPIKGGEQIELPCGKCTECRKQQRLMWALRCQHEASMHDRNAMLTLTYNERTCPDGLQPRDMQLVIKRLRHHYGKLRYFYCGEYGDRTHRPHYHALIFGEDFLAGAVDFDASNKVNPIVTEIWGNGHVLVSPVTTESICYVAGYVNKKMADEDTFVQMSRRPGIGHGWLDKYSDDLRRGYAVLGNRQVAIPKRYISWLRDNELADELSVNRREAARLHATIRTATHVESLAINAKARIRGRGEKI